MVNNMREVQIATYNVRVDTDADKNKLDFLPSTNFNFLKWAIFSFEIDNPFWTLSSKKTVSNSRSG